MENKGSRRQYYTSNKRKFFMLEKTPLSIALVDQARRKVAQLEGKPVNEITDAETIRYALSNIAK